MKPAKIFYVNGTYNVNLENLRSINVVENVITLSISTSQQSEAERISMFSMLHTDIYRIDAYAELENIKFFVYFVKVFHSQRNFNRCRKSKIRYKYPFLCLKPRFTYKTGDDM